MSTKICFTATKRHCKIETKYVDVDKKDISHASGSFFDPGILHEHVIGCKVMKSCLMYTVANEEVSDTNINYKLFPIIR